MTAVVPKIDSILQLIPANGFVDFETTTGPMRVPVVALAARRQSPLGLVALHTEHGRRLLRIGGGPGDQTVPHSENRR